MGAHTIVHWEILCFALYCYLGVAWAATVSTEAFLTALCLCKGGCVLLCLGRTSQGKA